MRHALLSGAYADEVAMRCRSELHELSGALIQRAVLQGALRADAAATGVPMLLLPVSSVVDFAGADSSDVWRRYLQLLLDGLAAPDHEPGASRLAAPLSPEQVISAVSGWTGTGPRARKSEFAQGTDAG